MPVLFQKDTNTFTIHTDHTTYQMKVDDYGYLLHLYYGPRSEGVVDWVLQREDRGFSGAPYESPNRRYSLDYLPQEFPTQGSGDFRSPLLKLRDGEGTYGCSLKYRSHEIRPGKYGLEGLPAAYSVRKEDDAETLEVELYSARLGLTVTLLYGVLPHSDIITRSAILQNGGEDTVTVEKFQTACLDFVHGNFDLITFHGRHLMERVPERRSVDYRRTVIGSRRGMSSHQHNPFVILAKHDTTEHSGYCYGMEFVYSGGFQAEAEKDQFNQTRLQMGLGTEKFSYPVAPGEQLIAPEVIMTFSAGGLSLLSRNLHDCIREHILRGPWQKAHRPILLNSWEANYFDFTGKSILRLARQAKELGIEMLVLDDGWYGRRNDDNTSLGDWYANEEKLGCTLQDLVDEVHDMGLKFGIWMEPEMVSEDSDLYRAHPDWAMRIPGSNPVLSRNQLVLDFSRPDVCDEVYEMICKVLDQGPDYLKWDYNRSIADVYTHSGKNQGKVLYDYILGLYSVLERLHEAYPDLLLEGCSGGGGRYDAGMLYYSPQIWCSDNTDAIDRLVIQYGTSYGYPPVSMGCHVSACPNHQTGRTVSMKTRGAVAMGGSFGYELDPNTLSKEEKEEVREQIAQYRKFEPLILEGDFYRLADPNVKNHCSWEFLSKDRSEALVVSVIIQNHGNAPLTFVTPRDLERGAMYRETYTGAIYAADALLSIGFPLTQPKVDGESYLFHFVKVTD